ncbi:glycosyltransferase family 4 protein [Methylophilus sp. Leaf408]|uniref:glycosyltransferase family 4 protein n=1 Tax=Methylophilus sp. Leaf408 TaxID=2876561 RepID=UPI001E47E907|nr:glycosyltransferase family 4 protein [Methylophilus sp. Leaf408]
MRVLYLHPAGAFGGASKSLIELYAAAKKLGNIEAVILTPAGTAATAFQKAGMNVVETTGLSQFDHTRYGYYRHLRWLILLRELLYLPVTLIALLRLRSQAAFDLIHVNEITLLPTAILARWIFKLPMVFHVRSVQHPDQTSWRTRQVFKLLNKLASTVICIDETVRASVPGWLKTTVIHNGISIESNLAEPQTSTQVVNVGMAGVLLRSKGVYEFLQAAGILVNDRHRAMHFTIAGENARETAGLKQWLLKKLGFYEDVLAEAKRFVRENGLEKHVTFKGFLPDIRKFYPGMDVICFPSHLNACGRPVFEAALFGIPSIVAIKHPLEDAIIHGVTGLAIDHPSPVLLADAIDSLALNLDFRNTLGQQARDWALSHFSIENSATQLLDIYFHILKK